MKRIALVLMAATALTACSNSTSTLTQTETDADGNTVYMFDYGNTVMPEELPVKLKYNDKTLTVTDFAVYQDTVNYEHYLYASATIDASDLTDEDFHWLQEDDVINAYAFVKGGENNLEELETLDPLWTTFYTSSRKVKIAWLEGVHDTYKKPFDGSQIDLSIEIAQDEGKPYKLSYNITPETIKNTREMDEAEKKFYVEATENKLNSLT